MRFKGLGIFLKKFVKEKDKKSYPRIVYEFIHLLLLHKEIPYHYFSRNLYRKEFKEYKDFIPIKMFFKLIFSKKIQDEFYVSILSDKVFFSLFCNQFNIPMPNLICYNRNGIFYYNENTISVNTKNELILFYSKLLNDVGESSIIVKSSNNKGGSGIFILNKESLARQIEDVGSLILTGTFIHQKLLAQHPEVSKIYPHSINSIRFDIVVDNKKQKHLLGAVMRFGHGGCKVDNVSKGGFFVPIDKTGCLMVKGYSDRIHGSSEYTVHPDTNFVFNGFQIPYFKEAKALALKMSQIIPNGLVGWDIAITPYGPIVIEGNHDSGITMTEIGYGGYLKHPIVRQLLARTS